MTKQSFLHLDAAKTIDGKHGTPCHVYSENILRSRSRELNDTFKDLGFRNFFAVKATPTPSILRILHEEGMGMDCSSITELELCRRTGITGHNIMFTSNNTSDEEFILACEMDAIINIDDYQHIQVLKNLKLTPSTVSFRYLPAEETFREKREHGFLIGGGQDSKFGITDEYIKECYREMLERGVESFGLHTMLASNERNPAVFFEVAQMMFNLAVELKEEVGVDLDFINLGGGFGIPHKPEETELDLRALRDGLTSIYNRCFHGKKNKPRIFMENGRFITGPAGCLLTKVRHVVTKHKKYIGVDASMSDFMRPALYGAYHHITTFNNSNPVHQFDITGSLCENNDKFAIDREISSPERGDYLIIHDTGAHGHAMGFNYNGKTRAPEVIIKHNTDETFESKLIRRREKIEDLFSTIVFQ